jgi:hypothetical protein
MRALVVMFTFLLLSLAAAEERAPEKLSQTGLYVAGRPGEIDRNNRPFSPQYPLWSDGATKRRWVYLPPGGVIDAKNVDEWSFPVGTRFWKEFVFNNRRVETRMSWKVSSERWVFVTYRWNDEQTDATLVSEAGEPDVVEVAPGKRHSLPGVTDCTTCHGTQRQTPLGFNALQLSPDRDPNAIHGEPLQPDMMTLRTLLEEQLLINAGHEITGRAPRIATASAQTRAVLGYFASNCGTCHNGRGEIGPLAPVLRISDLLVDGDRVARSFVGAKTKWQVPGVPEDESVVIDPTTPERSALLARMRSRRPSSQMPPLGTVVRDQAAVDAVTAWIPQLNAARQSRR